MGEGGEGVGGTKNVCVWYVTRGGQRRRRHDGVDVVTGNGGRWIEAKTRIVEVVVKKALLEFPAHAAIDDKINIRSQRARKARRDIEVLFMSPIKRGNRGARIVQSDRIDQGQIGKAGRKILTLTIGRDI